MRYLIAAMILGLVLGTEVEAQVGTCWDCGTVDYPSGSTVGCSGATTGYLNCSQGHNSGGNGTWCSASGECRYTTLDAGGFGVLAIHGAGGERDDGAVFEAGHLIYAACDRIVVGRRYSEDVITELLGESSEIVL